MAAPQRQLQRARVIKMIAPDALSEAVTGLTNGDRYWVQAAAVNAAGLGPWSEESSGVPEGSPGAPQSLRAVVGDESVHVEWDPPASDGGLAIIEYRLRWKARGEQYHASREIRTSDTEADIEQLVNGTVYDIAVTARNSVDWGDSVEERSVVPRTVPGEPRNLVATPEHRSIMLEWYPPADDGGDPVDEYLVTWQTGATTRERRVGAAGWTIAGLVNGAAYDIAVAAHNGAGDSSAARTGAVPRTVADPPVVTAADAGTDQMTLRPQITVRWNPPANNGGDPVSGYRLRWRASTEDFTDANWPTDQTAAGLTGTSHTIDDLEPDTGYRIQIAAVNGAGQGRWSAERSASTTPAIGSPTSLAATPADTAIELRWSPPQRTGGLTVTGYLLQWKSGTEQYSTTERKHQTGASARSYDIPGLVNGTAYDVAVTALSTPNNGGTARVSAIVPKTKPDAPRNLRTDPYPRAVDVAWDPPASDGGDRVTGYTVRWKPANGAFHPDDTQTVTATDKLITDLANGTAYDIEVTATNTAGTSPAAQISATLAATPDAPTVGTVAAGDTVATVTWTAPDDDGGAAITGHHVRWRANNQRYNDTDRIDTTIAADATSHTVTGLTNGTRYWIQVAAANTQGADNWSTETHTTPRTVPDQPDIASITTASEALTVRWSQPGDGGSDITGYELRWKNSAQQYNDTDRLIDDISHTRTSHTLTGLDEGVAYDVQILARNAVGPSDWSDEEHVALPGRPGQPRQLDAQVKDRALSITWSRPESDGLARVTRYRIEWRPHGHSYDRSRTYYHFVDANDTSETFTHDRTGLNNGTLYWIRVAAGNAKGFGPTTAEISATPANEPSRPTSLAVRSRHQELIATWEPPDDDGGSDITGYKIQWKPVGGDFNTPVTVGASTRLREIVNLANGTIHTVAVAAVNGIGDGEAATAAAAPVQGTAPGAPTVSIEPRNLGLRVTWEPPDNDGGTDITGYKIQWKPVGGDFNTPVTVGASTRLREIVNLANGTTYTVRVTALNSFGDGTVTDADAAPQAPVAPDAPANLRFELLHLGLRAVWDPPVSDGRAPITGYRLLWNDGMTPNRVDLTGRSHDLTGLDLWRTYPVRVSAVNSVGEGPAAANAGRPGHIPGPPLLPQLHSKDGQLTITWRRSYARWSHLGHLGTQVTSFRVQWKSAGQQYSPTRQAEIEPVPAPGQLFDEQDETRYRHSIEGLTNGTEYTVRVTAVNGHIEGAPIEVTGAPTAVAVGAPSSVSLYSEIIGSTDVHALNHKTEYRVSWQRVWRSGRALNSYRVQHKEAGQPDSAFISQSATGTIAVLDGLSAGTDYTVRVAAVLPGGGHSPATEITRTAQTKPTAPLNIRASAGDGIATLTWDPPRSGVVAGYRLYVRAVPVADLRADRHSYTITGLRNGEKIIDVFVGAQNGYGRSTTSTYPEAFPGAAPGAPQELSLVPGDASLLVSWQPPADDGGHHIGSYKVRWKGPGEDYHSDREATVDRGTRQSITGLTNATAYSVEVTANNSLGTGPARELSASPGAAVGVPAAPTGLAAVPGDTVLLVSWSPPEGEAVEVTGYRVRWKGPGEDYHSDREAAVDAADTLYNIVGLANGARYDVRIVAASAGGDSAVSTIHGTPAAVPSAVRGVIAVAQSYNAAQSQGTALLSWLPPDSAGGADIEYYRVVKESDGGFDQSRCGGDRADITGLHYIDVTYGAGTHRWQIAAVNSAGAGSAVEVEVTQP